MPDDDKDLEKAEQILREWLAGDGERSSSIKFISRFMSTVKFIQCTVYGDTNAFKFINPMPLLESKQLVGLMDAMGKRQLKELEQAIAYIKRNG